MIVYHNNYIIKVTERKWTFINKNVPQISRFTSTKPLQYFTISIITLGCPVNPVDDF